LKNVQRPILFVSAVAAGLFLAGCVREARIAMPAALAASTERLELRGLGGGTSGRFDLAGAEGRFTRTAERIAAFDPAFVRHRGGGSFDVTASPKAGALGGLCAYREARGSIGPLSVTPRRLSYSCDFARDGRPMAAGLVIENPASAFGTLHGREERIGTLHFEGREIGVRSIHRDAGGGLPVPHALGYLFEADGRAIGAVDLNGGNKTIFAPRSGADREAVIAGAVALSIFWDPAEVQS
jgi:hypothetical protein